MDNNPYKTPRSLNVDDYFVDHNVIMLFNPNGVFSDIEEMRQTFIEPDRLEVVHNGTALQLKR